MKIFDAVKGDLSKLGGSARTFGDNFTNSFKALGAAGSGAGAEAGIISKTLLLPVRAAVNVVRWPVSTVSWMYKAAPVPMAIATIGGAVFGIKKFFTSRARENTQRDLQNQMMEAQVIAQQSQPQTTYMNTVTSADMAAMDARIAADRAAGAAATTHVDAAAARASQQPAAAAL